MRAYVIRRLLLVIPTLLILSMLVFLLVRFVPGDVIDMMQGIQDHIYPIDREARETSAGIGRAGPRAIWTLDWRHAPAWLSRQIAVHP